MSDRIRLLYAEDNPQDADLTKAAFELNAPEFDMEVVNSGQKCLARLREQKPDVLLLDYHLPDMDGVDVLQELAAGENSFPVVMVTALGDEDLVVQLIRLGASDYVPKQGNYLDTLPSVLKSAVAEYRLLKHAGHFAQRARRRRVLYVENNPADIDLTISYFAEFAPLFTLDAARTSTEALERLRESEFDLVMVDLRMPDINALDFLIEAKHSGITVPFIVITGKGDEAAAITALKLGAYDYIVKRDAYLTQLPYAIENCIARAELERMNRQLQNELAERERAEAEQARVARSKLQLEEQLRQAQRIDSIGRLAGGVAHDFNNLLTVINGYADLMLLDLRKGDPLYAKLELIRKAGERAATLTRQLLAFSRRQVLQLRVLDLNALIMDSVKMLTRLLDEHIELVTALAPDLGKIKADAGQMDQVIVNLAVNARDAMLDGGRLTLETRNVTIDEVHPGEHPSLSTGAYVLLSVSDTGCGMDWETLAHVFEPFFTTKEAGRGTGLGLSTVYGIINQSGGTILVSSEPGRGTVFQIYLPRIDASPDVEEKRTEPEGARGTETILVVEDEEMVRRLTCDTLRKYGYDVIEAANPGEALLACEKHDGPIPLLITDVVMPQMGGRELAERLRQLRPEIRVLYMSGYTDDAVVRQSLLDPPAWFIQKPFSGQILGHKLREILK